MLHHFMVLFELKVINFERAKPCDHAVVYEDQIATLFYKRTDGLFYLLFTRSHAIACTNQFIIGRSQALMVHITSFVEVDIAKT